MTFKKSIFFTFFESICIKKYCVKILELSTQSNCYSVTFTLLPLLPERARPTRLLTNPLLPAFINLNSWILLIVSCICAFSFELNNCTWVSKVKKDLNTFDYSYSNSSFSQNDVFSVGSGDFSGTTDLILMKFKPHILHMNSFRTFYNRVQIFTFTIFFCQKQWKNVVFCFFF